LAAFAAVLTLATVFLTACSGRSPAGTSAAGFKTNAAGWVSLADVASAQRFAEAEHYTLMTSILQDGAVTRDEYTDSFNSWASCMQKAGAAFAMPQAMWNPTSNLELVRAWNVNPPTSTKAAQAVCWNQYNFIKDEFQKQNAPRTDPQLMSFVINCIKDKGGPQSLTPAVDLQKLGDESPDIADTNPNSPIPACVSSGISSLYPGLQGYSLAF
jgi:hypothetical protein